MKIVALDVGAKRIGVATADTAVKIAVPHSTVLVDGAEFEQIAKIMKDERSNRLVVGLPRNGQGEETAQSATVRNFIIALSGYFVKHNLERPLVKYQDESLTSVQAEQNLAFNRRKKTRAKGEVDREAATLILQDFLDSFEHDGAGVGSAGGMEDAGVKAGAIKEKAEMASDMWADNGKKKSKKRSRGFRIFATIVALLIVVVVGAIVWYTDSLKAVDPSNCQGVRCDMEEFVILDGESVDEVADRLASQGLIKNGLAFRIYLKLEQKEKLIKSGVYVLNSGLTVENVVRALGEGATTQTFLLEIAPGMSLAAVRERLIAVGYDKARVDAAFEKEYTYEYWGGEKLKVENFLYADEYQVGVGATVEDVLRLMLVRLATVSADNNLKTQFAGAGLSYVQGFELAARVRAEVGEVSEYAQAEKRKAAELMGEDDKKGVSGAAADLYALVGVAYWESKIPYVMAGDYKGWKDAYGELARKVGEANGIPYEAILAQTILESSWGKSKLAYKYFNFFGIKYANMPSNPAVAPSGSVNMTTWEEYRPGVSTTINADFAAWDSLEKGFSAYAAWIKAQGRYAGALRYPNDPIRYVEELKRAGYATDSNYVNTLTSIIKSLRES